jgi:hypothetical protein
MDNRGGGRSAGASSGRRLVGAAVRRERGGSVRGLEWLDRGIDERDSFIPKSFFEPFLDPLRSGPRYARVLERMGLARSGSR